MLISLLVYYVLVPLAFVACLYFMYFGRVKPGVVPALGMCGFALLAAHDGITLGAREYARAHDGRVTTGVVVAKLSATGLEHKSGSPGRQWHHPRLAPWTEGFRPHDMLERLILTGSLRAWSIEYRYDCERAQGCRDRDFVSEELWRSLYAGQPIKVCRSNGEYGSSRLEENPQGKRAIAQVAIAGALLLAAGAVSGHLKRHGSRYLTAPAVVTAVEPVRTHDVTRWKLTFAYFDQKGAAHEAADEILIPAFKAGDEGLAVFPPDKPDLATFRPPETA